MSSALGPCNSLVRNFARTGRGAALGLMLIAGVTAAAEAPYPASKVVTAMSWNLATVSSLRKAQGSDLWPLTWAADGNLYGAWGDGGGFDGNSNVTGRVSLGFARISGVPVAFDPSSYSGRNVWGDAPAYAEYPATFGGKVADLVSIDGVLYGQGGIWTAANCSCGDPTGKSGQSTQRTVIWSSDLGKSWQLAGWVSASDPGATLQFGQDYAGAADPAHVYFYYQGDLHADPGHLYLRRTARHALTADPTVPGHFEYATGAGNGSRWSTNPSDAAPVFYDSNIPPGVWTSAAVVYDPAIGRYLLSVMHGPLAGQIGFFEAPRARGPWSTVAYYDDWGGFNETAGAGNGLVFPSKWIGADGKSLWGVFSAAGDFDSFNVAQATLVTDPDIPRIDAPAAGTTFSPGAEVLALGEIPGDPSGGVLGWTAEAVGGGRIASGDGPELRFTIPAQTALGTLIRVRLKTDLTSVYRDYRVMGTVSP